MLGPARRENRKRFSRPKNSRGPKHSPILRPVSASLRLRFRSAVFSRALGNLVKICQHILTISLFRRCLPALEMGSLYPQFFVRALKNLIALKYVCKKARRNTLKIPAGVE